MKNQMYEYYFFQFQQNSIQVEPTRFDKGTQPHLLDQFIIVNAADLSETNFACYFTPDSLEPQPLTPTYLADKQALSITSPTPLKFSQILNVYYGSSNKGDVNLCNVHSFDYNIEGGVPAIAGLKTVTLNLTHMAKTLANVQMTIGFFDQGIINIRYTWDNQTQDKRVPLGVPQSIIDTTPRDISKL
jgi:hypothetical protein